MTFFRPKRALGQNFLEDPNTSRRIVAALGLGCGEPVLEIGPGRGALTRVLSGHDGSVLVLEKDTALARWLRREFSGVGVVHADALRFAWEKTAALPGLSLIGNLPYNVASPLIWELVSRCRAWRAMVFMVQKEVGERLCAKAGSSAYGALSAWVANFSRAEYLFTVSPHVFRPRPKVDSAVVRFVPAPAPAWEDMEPLSWLLKTLFQQRRKQLGTILRKYWSSEMDAWCSVRGVDRRIRPENLAPEALRSLSRLLYPGR